MMTDAAANPYDDQARLWNGVGGRAWVDQQQLLDRTLEPLEALLVEAVAARSGTQVLDVGCGTGATTLAMARRLGAKGRAVGIDISQPMIVAARARAARDGGRASFICADAQTHRFESASFDMIASRFGVMFFGDPVAAFSNLRRAAARQAGLCFLAWRGAAENPFMTTAERAAAPMLPALPVRRPGAPGQFAFADDQRVRRILEAGGWGDIDVRPVDVPCALPEHDLLAYATRLGPLGLVLHETDAGTRDRVVRAVRDAFDAYVNGDEVRFVAACWLVAARAP